MLELQFLGTAAAEGIPALFCRCPVCTAAAQNGGHNLRTRCGALLNGQILLDLTPDIYLHKLRYGLDLAAVEHLVITHSHTDHLAAAELTRRSTANYCHIQGERPLQLYGNCKVLAEAARALQFEFGTDTDPSFAPHLLEPYQPQRVGDLTFTPIPARHDPAEDCLLYLIADDEGHRMLYGNDTGLPDDRTVARIAKCAGGPLDLVSMDCTFGATEHPVTGGHMGLADNAVLAQKLREVGCVTDKTLLYATHFSHNCGMGHTALEQAGAALGIRITYDGLKVAV